MAENEKQDQKNKPAVEQTILNPKKGDPGYDEFMRNIFRKAASNMLYDDEI